MLGCMVVAVLRVELTSLPPGNAKNSFTSSIYELQVKMWTISEAKTLAGILATPSAASSTEPTPHPPCHSPAAKNRRASLSIAYHQSRSNEQSRLTLVVIESKLSQRADIPKGRLHGINAHHFYAVLIDVNAPITVAHRSGFKHCRKHTVVDAQLVPAVIILPRPRSHSYFTF